MAKGRRPTNTEATEFRSGSDTTTPSYAMEDGGCARVESEGTRMNPSWGKDASFPQTRATPEPESPQAILARKRGAQRNLGLRSHSGNSPEADAEG